MTLNCCNIVTVGKVTGVDFEKDKLKWPAKKIKQNLKSKSDKKCKSVFNGVVIRLKPIATCLLFPNGAVTVVCIKCLNSITCIQDMLITVLPAKLNVNITCSDLKVCNVVASFSVLDQSDSLSATVTKNLLNGSHIDIPKLFSALKNHYLLSYIPELFTGLKICLTKKWGRSATNIQSSPFQQKQLGITSPNLVAIIFHSGKVILTGAKSMLDISYGKRALENVLFKAVKLWPKE